MHRRPILSSQPPIPMTYILVETRTEQPITLTQLGDEGERVFPCLTARNAQWHYSLLAQDRHRMVCIFDAPDAESVRQAYRTAQINFHRIWAADPRSLCPNPAPDDAPRWVLEGLRRPLTEAEWQDLPQQFPKHTPAWMTAYLARDRRQMIWELAGDPPADQPWFEHCWPADRLTLSSFS
jgi:hypothetical protein